MCKLVTFAGEDNKLTLTLVAVKYHLKQKFGCVLVQRNIVDLVNHNQLHLFRVPGKLLRVPLLFFLRRRLARVDEEKSCSVRPAWQALRAMAVARWVLPIPTVPIKLRLSLGVRKCRSVIYSCVKPRGSSMAEFQTNSSRVKARGFYHSINAVGLSLK